MSEILCVSTFDIICTSNFNIKCVHYTTEILINFFQWAMTIIVNNFLIGNVHYPSFVTRPFQN